MKEYTKEPRKPCEAAQESLPEDMIEGRNAVTEALRSGRTINKVFQRLWAPAGGGATAAIPKPWPPRGGMRALWLPSPPMTMPRSMIC